MLDKITRRRLSKTAQLITILLILISVIVLIVIMLTRSGKDLLKANEPLGMLNQSKSITMQRAV